MIDGDMHVGFTGTQEGMTSEQYVAVYEFMELNQHLNNAHHGDCIGADANFHSIVQDRWTIGHPPTNPTKRAFCVFDEVREPKEYLVRNIDIVNESDFMIVVPKGFKEELRSGTWSTARYARTIGTHGLIFWPDGTVDDLIKE